MEKNELEWVGKWCSVTLLQQPSPGTRKLADQELAGDKLAVLMKD